MSSSSTTNIALVGATGNLGPSILSALLAQPTIHVTILTRTDSTSTATLPSHPRQTITKADFTSLASLTSALRGQHGLVSNMASHALLSQKLLIDAAIAAGVSRFLPSEFGSDLTVAANAAAAFNQPKAEIQRYLREKVMQHPEFSYTSVCNGPFLDWCLKVGLFGDLPKREMTLWDGGETRVTTTMLADVGKAVVGVFAHEEETKNRTVRVASATVSQRGIIEMAREVDGKEWTTKPGSTKESYETGLKEMQKEKPNMMVAVFSQLMKILFAQESEPDYEDKVDNKLLGVEMLTEEQVKEVVKRYL